MRRLLRFESESLRAAPLGLIAVIGVFFLIQMIETLSAAMVIGVGNGFLDQESTAMFIVLNLAILFSKGVVLIFLARTCTVIGMNEIPSPFRYNIRGLDVYKVAVITCLAVIGYRLFYDSSIGVMAFQVVGVDEELMKSFEKILGAPLLGLAYILIIGPIYEEIVYRGIIFGGMIEKGISPWLACLVSSALFGVMHMSVLQGINAFLIGLVLTYVYYKTGNLMTAWIAHIFNNVIVTFGGVAAYAFPVLSINENTPIAIRLGLTGIGAVFLIGMLRYFNKKAASLDTASSL